MKSYKQMAADVLHRAEVYTARKKRNQRIAVTAAAFGCLSVLIVVNIIKIGMGNLLWGDVLSGRTFLRKSS